MIELKPCPFCGGTGRLDIYISPLWQTKEGWVDSKRMRYIGCEDCGCRTFYFETAEDAVKAWNRRDNYGN